MVHTAQNSSEVGSFKQHSSSSTGSSGQETLPFHPEADDLGLQFLQGLPHSWPDGQQAINKGKYNQWIAAKSAVTMADLPDTSAYEPPDNDRHPDYRPTPPAVGSIPAQERGRRRTRPLPYASVVDGSVAGGKYTLTFGSGPKAGAQFLITSANRTDGPWTYTTEAGKSIADSWNTIYSNGVYDLTVHGPNGFLRTFKGKPATGLEVTARENAGTGDLDLTITTDVARRITITNAYGGSPKRLDLRPGTRTHTFTTTNRWYDVSITTNDITYLRRLAGHVETGTPGLSDPAIRTT
ncbi:phospholipase domain-containing protein [Kribbella sp. NPDC050470]|uniref:phospholipase domain-containing protein n=1 Tax=unclassified Kribbella TaxID=2644121 RepID=UPI00378B10BC